MKIKYEFSVSELKALLELIHELCKKNGLDEVLSRSLMRRLNDKDFIKP